VKNVTITLDEKTARWARVEAARRDMSLSSFLRDLLEERMRTDDDYEAAKRQYFSRKPSALKGGGRYPSREEIYDRGRLR